MSTQSSRRLPAALAAATNEPTVTGLSITAPVGPKLLRDLTIAVNRAMGQDPSAIEAAALWIRTAHHLGYAGEPHAVAAIIIDKSSQATALLGSRSHDYAAEFAKHQQHNQPRPGWGGAGHVIILVPQHKLLVDPAMNVINGHGIEAQPMVASMVARETRNGHWKFDHRSLDITYIPVHEDQSWQEVYRQNHEIHEHTAKSLADALKAGVSPEDIAWH